MAKLTGTELLVSNIRKTISDIKKGKAHSVDDLHLTKRRFGRLHEANTALHDGLIGDYVAAVTLHKPAMINALI